MSAPNDKDDPQAKKTEGADKAGPKDKGGSKDTKGMPALTPEDVDLIGGRAISTVPLPPSPPPPPVTGPPIIVTGNPPPPPPVTGPPITVTANPPPVTGSPPSPPPPPPSTPKFKTRGRSNCGPAASAVQQALDQLYAGSKTAASLIDQAFQRNVSINIIRIDTQDFGTQDDFDSSTNTVDFDPFSVANLNEGTTSVAYSPLVALGHEIAHAANPNATDAQIIADQNQIAAELNASYGQNNNTTRPTDSEGYGSYTNTDSVDSTSFSVERGDASCG